MIPQLTNKIFILTCLFLMTCLFITYEISLNFQFSVKYERPMEKNDGIRYILYWDKMWHFTDFRLGFGDKIFESCPVKNCFATNDKFFIPIEQFDALIFHGVQYVETAQNNPSKRNFKQVYIYMNLETPYNTPKHLKYSNGFFNWTQTYR